MCRRVWLEPVRVRKRRRPRSSARSHRTVPSPQSPVPSPQPPVPGPLYACIYRPPAAECRATLSGSPNQSGSPGGEPERIVLVAIAEQFSPRYERHRDDLVSIDVSGLGRLLGPARTIGEELRREAAARGVRAHVAVAGTRMAALVLALARPGLTVIPRGEEAAALAPIHIGILEKVPHDQPQSPQSSQRDLDRKNSALSAISAIKRWGLKTLGELASLPAADLVSRLGRPATMWQAIARGEDIRPLVPTLAEERFASSLELEWPIENLEPLSPMRDVRTLRTLALLDLESHPPAAAVDRVSIVIDPTPGRVLQHQLFTRAHPTPEQLSTLLARLGALMGSDRFGAPATVDSYRPGAFAMTAFATDHDKTGERKARILRQAQDERPLMVSLSNHAGSASSAFDREPSAISHQPLTSAVRR